MSSVQVQHEVLCLFTNSLLLRQALHYFALPRDCSLLSHESVLLSVRFLCLPKNHIKLQGEMYDQSKSSNVIIFWVLQVSPTHVGFFFPSVGDMWAAAKKLFRQPSDEPQWTFVKDYERSFSVFHNWNVTSDHWEKDKRAAWEPNRKTFWTLGPSSRSVSEKQF